MGYRSEVSIVMTKELFGKIYKDIPEPMNDLISYASKFRKQDNFVLLHWENIKWYADTDYPPGQFWSKLMFHTDGSTDFHFIELGEDADHNEERGELWDNPWSTSMVRTIHIDDCGTDVSLDAFA